MNKSLSSQILSLTFLVIRTESVLIVKDSISFNDVMSASIKVLDSINGNSIQGRVEYPDDEAIESLLKSEVGICAFYGAIPKKSKGQTSRFAIAWWTDSNSFKHLRVFGDRICCNQPIGIKYVEVPRLYPFGQESYHLIYPANHSYCINCKCNLKKGEGNWHKGNAKINLKKLTPEEKEPIFGYFLCNSCQYEEDTGFRQARVR